MTRWIEASRQDVGYAFRSLRKTSGFTLVAVLTLAIGIGATTAVFSVVNGILLRPLPYPDQDRLVALSNVYANRPENSATVSGTDVSHWKVDNQVFENLDFVSHPDIVAMSSAGSGERVATHERAVIAPTWNQIVLRVNPGVVRKMLVRVLIISLAQITSTSANAISVITNVFRVR